VVGDGPGGADAYRILDDPADASGKHLLVGRSSNEDYRQVTYNAREVELWCSRDSDNFVDLAAVEPSPPPTSKQDEDWEFSTDCSDVAESGDYSALSRR
jgi:hypothetical protein